MQSANATAIMGRTVQRAEERITAHRVSNEKNFIPIILLNTASVAMDLSDILCLSADCRCVSSCHPCGPQQPAL